MQVELTALQARAVTCLIEKGATTPDNYPLTTNALVAACNQSTNRDPVVDYTSRDVDSAMIQRLSFRFLPCAPDGTNRLIWSA